MTELSHKSKEANAIMGLVDTYIRWRNYNEKYDRKYKHYHPSEWGRCLRAQQYKHYQELGYIDVEYQGIDSTLSRLFDKGHNMHNRWVSYFDNIGGVLRGRWKCNNKSCHMFDSKGKINSISQEEILNILSSTKSRIYGDEEKCGIFKPNRCVCGCKYFEYLETQVFSKELNMKGHADIILDCDNLKEDRFKEIRSSFNFKHLPQKGEKAVIDMKSIGDSSWNFQLKKKGAHIYYMVQIMCYTHILGCNYGVLIYENKNNSEVRSFKIERNDEWWKSVEYQAKTMINMTSKKALPPPRPKDKANFDCKNCDFRQLCHKSKIWKSPNLNKMRRNFYRDLM